MKPNKEKREGRSLRKHQVAADKTGGGRERKRHLGSYRGVRKQEGQSSRPGKIHVQAERCKEMRKTSSHPGTLASCVTDRKMQDCGAE